MHSLNMADESVAPTAHGAKQWRMSAVVSKNFRGELACISGSREPLRVGGQASFHFVGYLILR